MIEPTLLIAIIVAVSAIMQTILNSWQAKRRQKADWRRQDGVAEKAEETASLLLKTQKENIRRTDEVARVAAISANQTHDQLSEIHGLVNSDMTKVLQADLDQTRVTLALLRKLGDPDMDLLHTTECRITELERVLATRPKSAKGI